MGKTIKARTVGQLQKLGWSSKSGQKMPFEQCADSKHPRPGAPVILPGPPLSALRTYERSTSSIPSCQWKPCNYHRGTVNFQNPCCVTTSKLCQSMLTLEVQWNVHVIVVLPSQVVTPRPDFTVQHPNISSLCGRIVNSAKWTSASGMEVKHCHNTPRLPMSSSKIWTPLSPLPHSHPTFRVHSATIPTGWVVSSEIQMAQTVQLDCSFNVKCSGMYRLERCRFHSSLRACVGGVRVFVRIIIFHIGSLFFNSKFHPFRIGMNTLTH